MPNAADRPRRVSVDRDGPILVEGPVEFVQDDGTVVSSDRFVVAICTCRRSRTYPWCDTSHRGHKRPPNAGRGRQDPRQPDHDPKERHDGDHH
ncbi:Iron-binding zinc finger CDGSH type [Streptomyces sp. DvalAA-14]|uniref:CDGSH iron-sulfur domain-containing protein n=1 Tax=unclassified Streptomyces TaxID=2593676 RepID=UPI00081B05E4|nr:CDGSH iron-sulfur domain-containing protein [Streptomyces sp. DvalAA-14]MYS20527.1 CDGSH iron-sulfur domain-containing protein [Streptomyces sp. SID4948]SCD71083.1 Iron-binding zinc finger CDGSH type [Streptomyces sp. DvalAA-14]